MSDLKIFIWLLNHYNNWLYESDLIETYICFHYSRPCFKEDYLWNIALRCSGIIQNNSLYLCLFSFFPLPHEELDWDHQLILAGQKKKKPVALFTVVLCVCVHVQKSACFKWTSLSSQDHQKMAITLIQGVKYEEIWKIYIFV